MSKDDSSPAFPSGLDQQAEYSRQFCEPMYHGMTRRQWLAGLAMQGMIDSGWNPESDFSLVVASAYAVADAMLAHECKEATG